MELDTEKIKTMRLERFWSQIDLADAAGLTESTINRLENGLQVPRISTVRKLASAFGVVPASLLKMKNGDQA